jgi:hypothetical protein
MHKCFRAIVLTLIVSLLGVLLAPPAAQSQVLISLLLGDKVSSEKFHLGVEGGLNLSDLNGLGDTKLRTGLSIGVIGEWRFARNWYLQPALLPFYWAGAKNLPESLFPPPPEVEDIVSGNEILLRTKYFAIPVLLKYGVADNRLLFGVGPQVGFLLSAEDTYKGTSVNGNQVTIDEDVEGMLASTDAGVLFNVEWKVRLGFSPSVVARYYLGLVDTIENNPGDAVYNRVLSILLTIPIGGDSSKEEGEEGS